MGDVLPLLLCAVIGYLLGSISVGVLYSERLGRDIRTVGSKNAGATNMTRIHGLRPGSLTFIGDCAKGVLAALIGRWIAGQTGAMVAGFLAVIGHNWPVFFGFRGGKGVASVIGVGLITYPPFAALGIVLGVAAMLISKFVSLGSIVGVATFGIGVAICHGIWPAGAWALVMVGIVIARHHGNISRLLHGTERKMGQKE